MKQCLICFLSFFCVSHAWGQIKAKTDCNTIFVCIDSLSYESISSNAFIRDTIFLIKAQTTSTTDEVYFGKYLIGKLATIELFRLQKASGIGNRLGDFGIEFKIRKAGQLRAIIEKAEKSKMVIDTLTTKLSLTDTILPWYKEVVIKGKNHTFSILEYQMQYLKYLGFNDSEIENEMNYEQFNSRISNGKTYPRQFNTLKSITLSINKNELESLRQYCKLNELEEGRNCFFNSEF